MISQRNVRSIITLMNGRLLEKVTNNIGANFGTGLKSAAIGESRYKSPTDQACHGLVFNYHLEL